MRERLRETQGEGLHGEKITYIGNQLAVDPLKDKRGCYDFPLTRVRIYVFLNPQEDMQAIAIGKNFPGIFRDKYLVGPLIKSSKWKNALRRGEFPYNELRLPYPIGLDSMEKLMKTWGILQGKLE